MSITVLQTGAVHETLIKLTGSLTCYCGNKSGSYRNQLLVTGGAVEQVCLDNCTPS